MKKVIVFVAALLLVAVANARADFATLQMKDVPGTTYGGIYVGQIGGFLNGSSTETYYVCNDYLGTTYVPSAVFDVHVSTAANLSGTKFGSDETAKVNYQKAAWLLTEMRSFTDAGHIGAMQYAMWQIFTPDSPAHPYPTNGVVQADVTYWADQASLHYRDYRYDSVMIYTPINTSNQEFMAGSGSPVPVPTSLLLLLPGFMGIVCVRRRIWK